MKIVWLSHTAETHGAELSLLEAAEGLSGSGHEVEIVVPWEGPLMLKLKEKNLHFQIIPYLFWTRPYASPISLYRKIRHIIGHIIAALKLVSLLRKLQCDIVITNTLTIPVGAIAAKIAGIPHVWYIHEFGEEDHNITFQYGKRFSLWFMNRFSDRIIVNSQTVRSKFQEYIDKEKMSLIYYGVQMPSRSYDQRNKDSALKLILVGRIHNSKRQEDALRAVAVLRNRGLNVHLTIVGSEDRQYVSFLRELIGDLGIKDMVTFFPFTNDPFQYVALHDIALICSRNEAFGRVTVEAMKMGKPVIGAKSGGTTELVQDGWNGFLYSPGDAEDLADKIAIFYENRDKIRELGSNAKLWALERFNSQKYIADLTNVFETAVRNKV